MKRARFTEEQIIGILKAALVAGIFIGVQLRFRRAAKA